MARLPLALLAAALALGGLLLPDFYVVVLNYVGLYALVALGVVLLTGVAGVTSFGQAAFVGLAAYATAMVTLRFGLSPWIGLLVALALTLGAAAILGGVTLRLSGHYLPLGTIAWGLSVFYVFGNLELLGGHTGLTDIPSIVLGPLRFETGREFFVLIWVVTIAAVWLVSNMLDSRAGRAMRACKSARETAESFGIDVARTRFVVFLYAAALACVSGWLYAHMLRFVNPSPFSLTMGIEYLFMAVVGGAGHVWGALLGAGIITVMKEYLQTALPGLIGQAGNFEVVVFGALVIALLQLNRDKGLGSLLERLRRRPAPNPPDPDAPKLSDRPDKTAPATEPVLEVRGLSKRFGGLQALNDVGFTVGRAEIVAIIGPNGAGKSTLFNAVTGLLEPETGEVRIAGRPLPPASPREVVRRGLSRTFQHVQLVPELTVLENTMLGAHIRGQGGSIRAALRLSATEEAAITAEAGRQLARVGLTEVMHQPATSLALGQQRLLEIARALCADPDLILLDEPAAGLRHREKADLAALLRALRSEGVSVLLVEHDMDFVMNLCDRVVVMNFGEKLLEGSPARVRSDPRVIEAYLGASAA